MSCDQQVLAAGSAGGCNDVACSPQISEGENSHIMGLEHVYAQPNINWTASQDYAPYIRSSKGEGQGHDLTATHKYIDLLMFPTGDELSLYVPWLHARSAEELDLEEELVLVLLNRGTTQQLFRNPYLEARLSQMGLREDTAFGCAMEYLFRCAWQALLTARGSFNGCRSCGHNLRRLPGTLIITAGRCRRLRGWCPGR